MILCFALHVLVSSCIYCIVEEWLYYSLLFTSGFFNNLNSARVSSKRWTFSLLISSAPLCIRSFMLFQSKLFTEYLPYFKGTPKMFIFMSAPNSISVAVAF